MGADPLAYVAAAVAATRGRPIKVFSVRKEAKDHGGGGRSPARSTPATRWSSPRTRRREGRRCSRPPTSCATCGAEPVLLCALVDRGGTCAAMAAAEGIAFTAIVTAEDLGFPFEGP